MTTILDTNILLRYSNPADPMYAVTNSAVQTLTAQGNTLRTLSQCLYEFWVTATRPTANNGLGLTPARCRAELDLFEATFPPLAEPIDLLALWKALVTQHQCVGKVAHDARIAAAMLGLGIGRILTFNVRDFRRYGGLTVLDPAAVVGP